MTIGKSTGGPSSRAAQVRQPGLASLHVYNPSKLASKDKMVNASKVVSEGAYKATSSLNKAQLSSDRDIDQIRCDSDGLLFAETFDVTYQQC